MPLIHGRPITAEEVESIVSREFSAKRFASLCNAITWTISGRRCPTLPSFTERVNARDGGIDAEWQIDLPDGTYESPLMGLGWNVSQYKQRDVFALGRAATIRALLSGLEGAVRDIAQRTERYPSRYVLFVNLDLTHMTKGQKGALKQKILEGSKRRIPVEIVGAAELAALLSSVPHLRSAFFAPTQFSTWEAGWDSLMRTKLFGASVRLVGRDEQLSQVRSLVDDPQVRAIVLAGAHNIGKSRLALQSCEHRPHEAVVALDPSSMTIPDVLALASPGTETVVVIDDPDLDLAEDLVEHALVNERLKILITLPTSEKAPAPSFGRDRRVQTVPLEPLSEQQAEELLRAAGAHFDYGLESWVVSQAGGTPGILLFAASLGSELRKTTATFAEDVGRAFQQRIARVLGDAAVIDLRLLSVLTHVGVSGQPARELELVCMLLGDGRSPHAVLDVLSRSVGAGVVRRGGRYVEVVPPLLANHLAGAALRGRFAEVCSLFGGLAQAGRLRLLRRLRQVRTEETDAFWDALFGDGGLLQDLPAALGHGPLLRLVAGTVPEKVAALICAGLMGRDLESRRAIQGDGRRSLMGAIEELLFRDSTSRQALESVAMLAEAENETYGNNATGVFSECFHPLHPQMPLALSERVDVVRGLLAEEQPREKKLLAIRAIETALGHSPAITLRRSEGVEPLGVRPPLTYREIWDYIEELAELLIATAQAGDAAVASAATQRLPHVLAEAALKARPEAGIARLKALVDWAMSGRLRVSVADASDAVERIREELDRRRSGAADDVRARLDPLVAEADALIHRLDEADYPARFRRWIGKWSRADHEDDVDEHGQPMYRGEKEIRRLAREAVEDPAKLTDDLLEWLCSRDAQKVHMFTWWLGRLDENGFWREKIERCGSTDGGVAVFGPYFGGRAQSVRLFVSQRLDELLDAGNVTGAAIVSATGYLGGDVAGVARTVKLLSAGRADPDVTARVLSGGGWITSLAPGDYLKLVQAIAGPGLEHAMAVIDFFGMWLHNRKPLEGDLGDFAWTCLGALPRGSANEHYDCDQLAAHLGPSDPERAFRLLERSLAQPYDRENWSPLRHHGERRFWSVLLGLDRARALGIVLGLALSDELARLTITWDLREVVDQERDADVLIAFALEGERNAQLIADSVSAARPGFWPIAFRLIQAYPKNERIQGRLAGAAEHGGSAIWGPLSAHYEGCRREVEARLAAPNTPAAARGWLRKLEAALRGQAERELLSDIEDDVNEVRRIADVPDAPERGWAISTLLRLGKVREALAIAERRELLRCLSRLKVPKKGKARLRRVLDELSGAQQKRGR